MSDCAESIRLAEEERREKNWKRWGTYLPERQWGTVREDYSPDGNCWNYFPHDDARSRVYRWGEDGLLGWTDRECRLCLAPVLWNGHDPILKERFFGLTNGEGNHGEDVKEIFFYLDATPTHSYQKALYKYPQRAFPYDQVVAENARRSKQELEYEITDTDAFAENRYFDVVVEYAKANTDDILVQYTITNHGPEAHDFHLLPMLWFRNTWGWGPLTEDSTIHPHLRGMDHTIEAWHATLGTFYLHFDPENHGALQRFLFTENETNFSRLDHQPNRTPHVKDAFHDFLIHGKSDAVNPDRVGTRAAAHYLFHIAPGATQVVRLRLSSNTQLPPEDQRFGAAFSDLLAQRKNEADAFYQSLTPYPPESEEYRIVRQAHAGLLWSKQFYHYEVTRWLEGDPGQPKPPEQRTHERNADWPHIFNRDVLLMPDKWEYPWYASWDLAFHTVETARIDPVYAKQQLSVLLREWYMHPNGQIPAYEFAFSDVNPPVHAWAAWRVYKITGPRGKRDRPFLESIFQKLLINFTWWVNRKDSTGRNLFSGGFLGLDNIGVFDRSKPLSPGTELEQADGTAWMAFYCLSMLAMALELAQENAIYEDIASKFFEHFVAITQAVNTLGGSGLWHEQDGFYYDQIATPTGIVPLKIRSVVGLLPLIAAEVLPGELWQRLPNFTKRAKWFLKNRPELAGHISQVNTLDGGEPTRFLALPSRHNLESMLRYMLNENEFLSPYGLRSVSKYHEQHPYHLQWDGQDLQVDYAPGESTTSMFGGNSNWRGPIWFPINYLLIEALQRYHHFYGSGFRVECPVGSGHMMDLNQVAQELNRRLAAIFLPGPDGLRPYATFLGRYANDPLWRDHLLFNEYFHGDTGRGIGASHQTGWTALIAGCLRDLAVRKCTE